ncbi:MAG TPA: nucleotidyltransferase family protein [Candidatus Eisenbacteria bacterium]|nr:nucleotidyltransferase family protein [Candidatus Eisenbacteria bacterium]
MIASAHLSHEEAGTDPETRPVAGAGPESALWPTTGQELLLRASVMDGEDAIAAWGSWKSHHDLIESHLDHGSFRLLPLVYRNLLAQEADEPEMPRLKGIYRYWWCSNQRLFYRAAGVVQALEAAGIRTLLLKGTALSLQFYRDTGVRPMGDIDLLVPWDRAKDAIACLGRHGWRPARPRVHDLIRYQHCVRLEHETGEALDLHWHVLRECVGRDDDRGFWERAVPVEVLHARSLALGSTDALLHTIVHGMRWNEEPTVRWIPDAMRVLREGGIDWALLLEEARRRQMVMRTSSGLHYLRRALGAPIPDHALAMFRDARPSRFERVEYRMLTFGSEGRSGIGPDHVVLLWTQYRRFVSGMSPGRAIVETPAYVRYRLRGRPGPFFDAVRSVRRWMRGPGGARRRPSTGHGSRQGS